MTMQTKSVIYLANLFENNSITAPSLFAFGNMECNVGKEAELDVTHEMQ